VSHPIDGFIPDCIPRDKCILLGASTDVLDGLNKEMSETDMAYYQLIFNRLSKDQCDKEIDFTRPYIVQVARFDPSKGIKSTCVF
jgi:alpha,alpha-trehalose phosphorylase (configuration-retaining)